MKNQILNTALILIMSSLIFMSCEKEDNNECEPDPHTHNTGTGSEKSVMLDFQFDMNGENFNYNTAYAFDGVAVEFSEIRFYVSDIALADDAGEMYMMDETILVDVGADQNMFTVGDTELAHIHELHMRIGLNDVVNHEDPITAEAPLNDAGMHWNWNTDAGYKFIKAEFLIDTDNDGVPETAASIHCATDELDREIMFTAHMDVMEDDDHAHINFSADVADFFTGVDFLNLAGIHGNSPLTNLVADNVSGAINIE